MIGQTQNRLYTRTKDGETARWIQQQLGSAEIEQSIESQQMGADAQRDGVSVQRSIRQRDLVLASEIQTLPDLTAYLSTVDEPVRKVRYTWTAQRSDPAEEMVAAPEPEPPRPPPWARARKHLQRAKQLGEWGELAAALDEAKKGLALAQDEKVQHDAQALIDGLVARLPELLEQAEAIESDGELPRALELAEQALRLTPESDTGGLTKAWRLLERLRGLKPRWEQAAEWLELSRGRCARGDVEGARELAQQAKAKLGDGLCLAGLDAWTQEVRGRLGCEAGHVEQAEETKAEQPAAESAEQDVREPIESDVGEGAEAGVDATEFDDQGDAVPPDSADDAAFADEDRLLGGLNARRAG